MKTSSYAYFEFGSCPAFGEEFRWKNRIKQKVVQNRTRNTSKMNLKALQATIEYRIAISSPEISYLKCCIEYETLTLKNDYFLIIQIVKKSQFWKKLLANSLTITGRETSKTIPLTNKSLFIYLRYECINHKSDSMRQFHIWKVTSKFRRVWDPVLKMC